MTSLHDLELRRPDEGKPMIGWFCSYTPEELVLAAGCAPIRVGSTALAPESAEAYLPANICPYVRGLLAAAMGGGCAGMLGVVFVLSCDAMRRLADIWERYVDVPILATLDVPRRTGEPALRFFIEQLRSLLAALEAAAGLEASEAALRQAIRSVNDTRRLIGQLSELRRCQPPETSGSRLFELCRLACVSDKECFNDAARQLLSQPDQHARACPGGPRLLLCGSIVDDIELVEQIEQCGAGVVADDLCTGLRHFDELADEAGDPLAAIARRYLGRARCARMQGAEERVDYILELARGYGADGVVYHTLKFCDPVQADGPMLRRALEGCGIPVLHIERDLSSAVEGQLSTRIGAFVEMLRQGRQQEVLL